MLYIIDSIILILLKAITYNLYIYNQRGVIQLINIYISFYVSTIYYLELCRRMSLIIFITVI